jgi:hypothetical protein
MLHQGTTTLTTIAKRKRAGRGYAARSEGFKAVVMRTRSQVPCSGCSVLGAHSARRRCWLQPPDTEHRQPDTRCYDSSNGTQDHAPAAAQRDEPPVGVFHHRPRDRTDPLLHHGRNGAAQSAEDEAGPRSATGGSCDGPDGVIRHGAISITRNEPGTMDGRGRGRSGVGAGGGPKSAAGR